MKSACFVTMLAALLLAAVGCDGEKKSPDADPATSGAESEAPATVVQLPVKEDFEEEAEQAIDEDNLEASVQALEDEISHDES